MTIDLKSGRDVRTANEWRAMARKNGDGNGQHHAKAHAREHGAAAVRWMSGKVIVYVRDGNGDVNRLRFAA